MRLARREGAAADRDEAVLVVADFDVAHADRGAGAQHASCRAQTSVRRRAQIVDAHVDGRDAATELGGETGVADDIDECRDDAAVAIGRVGRPRERRPMVNGDRQLVVRRNARDDAWPQPLMERRPRQQGVDEIIASARSSDMVPSPAKYSRVK